MASISVNGWEYKSRSDLAMDLLQSTNLSMAEIGRQSGITTQTVFDIKKRYNVKRPK